MTLGDGRSYFKLGTNVSEFISTLSAGGGKGPIVQGSRKGEGEGVSSTMAPYKCQSRQGLRRVGGGGFHHSWPTELWGPARLGLGQEGFPLTQSPLLGS